MFSLIKCVIINEKGEEMSQSLLSKIKCLIWFVAIIVLVLLACGIKSCTVQPEAFGSLHDLSFCPPDLVPHPELPDHVPLNQEQADQEEYDDFMRSQGLESPFENLILVG